MKERQNIRPVVLGRIQNIPANDSSFDVTYSRHILEHLDSCEQALTELVRVAKKEVIIVFFINPIEGESDEIVTGWADGYPIYHNRYSKTKIEKFLNLLPKVKKIFWEDVPGTNESLLHITVAE